MIKRSGYPRWQVICLFLCAIISAEAQTNRWQYYFPHQGAESVPVHTTLIFRSVNSIPKNFKAVSVQISVQGSISGAHTLSTIPADDGATLIFKPGQPFSPGESVLVRFNAPALGLAPLQYRFTTSAFSEYDPRIWENVSDDLPLAKKASDAAASAATTVINGVAVPADYPKMKVTVSKETAKGKIFIANWGGTSYMMILENDGTPYFYKRFPGSNQTRDFKVQPTGTLTRRVYENMNCFVEMDSQYNNIDTLRCGNGLGTDEHECQLLPNHHCLLIGLDYRMEDMSKLVSGGSTNATIVGNTIQELDEHHNVVFNWRSWDNFKIQDAVNENLKGGTIDYVHMNSIAVDYDSNLVISSRHLSEVTKINRKTGKIIWRLGGVNNQFTFVDDPSNGISYQHDARPVPGHPDQYTIFDDGNFRSTRFSRVVEYKLDTLQKTATLVWEYRHTPDYYTYWMASAQRLSNGNTFIDWSDYSLPKANEVTPSGEIVYEANFELNTACYRSFRFEWESIVRVPYLVVESYPNRVALIFNKFGDKKVKRYIIYGGFSPNPTTPLDSTNNTWLDLTNLSNNNTYYFRVTARDSNDVESPYSNQENVLVNMSNPGDNLVRNGNFSLNFTNWKFNLSNGGVAIQSIRNAGEYSVMISNGGTQATSVQLLQEGIPLQSGIQYLFEFDAYAKNVRTIDARLEQVGGSNINYSRTSTIALTKLKAHKSYPFTMTNTTDVNARVTFNLGTKVDTVFLDNISVKQVVPSHVEEDVIVPFSFQLEQNYPNPFNPTTTFRFQLPGSGKEYAVSLLVYDLLGRNVASLMNDHKSSGSYTVQWNAAGFPSGIYFCKLIAQPIPSGSVFQTVRKILLMK